VLVDSNDIYTCYPLKVTSKAICSLYDFYVCRFEI